MCVCVVCCFYFWGQASELGPVHWGQFVQLRTKAVSPIGKNLIFGSVVKFRVRVSFQKFNVSLCNVLESACDLVWMCVIQLFLKLRGT